MIRGVERHQGAPVGVKWGEMSHSFRARRFVRLFQRADGRMANAPQRTFGGPRELKKKNYQKTGIVELELEKWNRPVKTTGRNGTGICILRLELEQEWNF